MKKWISALLFSILCFTAQAQCAMCRATLENNLSDGDLEVGSMINLGILYLFVTPYLALGFIAIMWYRHSRANAARQ